MELAGGHRPDTPQVFHSQWVEKGELAVGGHHQQAVRLGDTAGDFGQELGPGHADGDGQTDSFTDLAA